jgi:hypothetical protein
LELGMRNEGLLKSARKCYSSWIKLWFHMHNHLWWRWDKNLWSGIKTAVKCLETTLCRFLYQYLKCRSMKLHLEKRVSLFRNSVFWEMPKA